jgi:hypothetical protein
MLLDASWDFVLQRGSAVVAQRRGHVACRICGTRWKDWVGSGHGRRSREILGYHQLPVAKQCPTAKPPACWLRSFGLFASHYCPDCVKSRWDDWFFELCYVCDEYLGVDGDDGHNSIFFDERRNLENQGEKGFLLFPESALLCTECYGDLCEDFADDSEDCWWCGVDPWNERATEKIDHDWMEVPVDKFLNDIKANDDVYRHVYQDKLFMPEGWQRGWPPKVRICSDFCRSHLQAFALGKKCCDYCLKIMPHDGGDFCSARCKWTAEKNPAPSSHFNHKEFLSYVESEDLRR